MKNKIELIAKIIELVKDNDGDIKSNNSPDALQFKGSLGLTCDISGKYRKDDLGIEEADKIYNIRYQDYSICRNILMQAIYVGCNKVAELLINSGFDLNYNDLNGDTALSYAIANDATEIAELLIEKGSKLSAKYSDSCLILAKQKGNKKIAELLQKIMYEPTSRVIQITATQNHDKILCEDGSIWEYRHKDGEWTCILKGISDRQKIIFDKRNNNLNN